VVGEARRFDQYGADGGDAEGVVTDGERVEELARGGERERERERVSGLSFGRMEPCGTVWNRVSGRYFFAPHFRAAHYQSAGVLYFARARCKRATVHPRISGRS
jgi:hypothetical protein